ncbi:MAG: hypothetical protein AB1640_24195 [bacterium]
MQGGEAYAVVYLPVNNPTDLRLLGISTTNAYTPSSDIPEGDYAWMVVAWSQACGLGLFSVPTFFTIPGTCPTAPPLLSPADGARLGSTVSFSWASAAGEKAHLLRCARLSSLRRT